jgi:hypothetical protein
MEAVAPSADGRAMRARLALAWAAVHGFCTLRVEVPGGELFSPGERSAEVAEDMLALLVAACASPPGATPP